uniref:Uncharacterized protein n=1 Tax=Alexandrium catenella TaxID=2925 RepID=A0A7S1LP74_ALECA|mmetsp:Transcript_117592/g.312827  ORF Transcript_117592/g.312827 Transcript_117592/m.312827 type:complete len:188 (+) Transcript_117592:65-628(+)
MQMSGFACALLCQLLLLAGASRSILRSAPDVASRVAAEYQQNIQIHDGFLSQEQQDIEQEKEVMGHRTRALATGKWVVALDHDEKTKMLVQMRAGTSQPSIRDPCSSISCGSLVCPAGFVPTSVEGHCCPYCVNPNIKIEPEVQGATGGSGGVASAFCKDVWCFPTMCARPLQNPSTTNGQCCPICP